MEFCLTYNGPLRSQGDAKHKHAIRRALHPQMKELWRLLNLELQLPHLQVIKDGFGVVSLAFPVGEYVFLPFVTARLKHIAELDILFLRRQEPGSIATTGGDIDNRIKTPLDALRIPKVTAEIPPDAPPSLDENPFCCLLEDDVLITKLAIVTDRWLEPGDPSDVRLTIRVQVKPTTLIWDEMMKV